MALADELAEIRARVKAARKDFSVARCKVEGQLVCEEQKVLRLVGDMIAKDVDRQTLEQAESTARQLRDQRNAVRSNPAFTALDKMLDS